LISPAEALEFLWHEQTGFFELAPERGRVWERRLYGREEALASLAGHDRFGPLARTSDDPGGAGVAEAGNVLWVDIDDPAGIEDRLGRIPVPPSLLVFSGRRGYWAFWKLTQPIATGMIEIWNRRLAHRIGGDRGSCARAQLARLPGSVREETGLVAEVVDFDASGYEPERLDFLRRRLLGGHFGLG
jgi:hypothetical protein